MGFSHNLQQLFLVALSLPFPHAQAEAQDAVSAELERKWGEDV